MSGGTLIALAADGIVMCDHAVLGPASTPKELGLHISCEMPPHVLEPMALYPQPLWHYPTVEYLPGRRVTERKIELGESGAEV